MIKILRFDEQRWRKIIYIKIIFNVRSRYTRRYWADLSTFAADWSYPGCCPGHLWIHIYQKRRSWLNWSFKWIFLFCHIWRWFNRIKNTRLYIYKGMIRNTWLMWRESCDMTHEYNFLGVWQARITRRIIWTSKTRSIIICGRYSRRNQKYWWPSSTCKRNDSQKPLAPRSCSCTLPQGPFWVSYR